MPTAQGAMLSLLGGEANQTCPANKGEFDCKFHNYFPDVVEGYHNRLPTIIATQGLGRL